MIGDVSVVICAYTERRWRHVVAAVRSVQQQSLPVREILLVVDHNARLAERARLEFPGVRVLRNSAMRGLSGARNTAIAAAGGGIIAFLDDDATAQPDWLERLIEAYDQPDVIAVGGAAHPVWPANQRPRWLPRGRELDWIVGCSYSGQPEHRAEIRNVMGCNMSFRRSVFDNVGRFAEHIGRLDSNPLGCEETELCIRATQLLRGTRIVFEPRAVVRHHVDVERTTFGYLVRRCWAEGLSKAAIARMVGATDALAMERRYLRRVLPAAVVRELRQVFRGGLKSAAAAFAVPVAVMCTAVGYLWAAYARR